MSRNTKEGQKNIRKIKFINKIGSPEKHATLGILLWRFKIYINWVAINVNYEEY